MILQPTEQELKERGFKKTIYWRIKIPKSDYIRFMPDSQRWAAGNTIVYPTSWDDIDRLIELLTPKAANRGLGANFPSTTPSEYSKARESFNPNKI